MYVGKLGAAFNLSQSHRNTEQGNSKLAGDVRSAAVILYLSQSHSRDQGSSKDNIRNVCHDCNVSKPQPHSTDQGSFKLERAARSMGPLASAPSSGRNPTAQIGSSRFMQPKPHRKATVLIRVVPRQEMIIHGLTGCWQCESQSHRTDQGSSKNTGSIGVAACAMLSQSHRNDQGSSKPDWKLGMPHYLEKVAIPPYR